MISHNHLKYLSYYRKTQQSEFIHRSQGLKLRGGQSYHLKITPQVRSTTESFDEISLEDRECKLPHEVTEDSFLNSYSERGCIFECTLRSAVRMRQVPLELDINIAINGCSGFATSTQKGPFMAMWSRSRDTYPIVGRFSLEYQVKSTCV